MPPKRKFKRRARPEKRVKTPRLAVRLPPMEPRDVRLLEANSIQPPQYFRLLLPGISESREGYVVKNPKEVGYGIIRLLTEDKGVLMRPILNIEDKEFLEWPTTSGEHAGDFRHMFYIEKDCPKTPVNILTIPEHAVLSLSSHQRPSSATTDVQSAPDTIPRYCRSTIIPNGSGLNIVKQYFACDACQRPLFPADYAYCGRCNEAIHLGCTTSRQDQPFVLRGIALYSRSNEKVQCPICTKKKDQQESHVVVKVVPRFTFYVDLGSDHVKASGEWETGTGDTSGFVKLAKPLESAVSVHPDGVFAAEDVHELELRYSKGHIIKPVKKLLYDKDSQEFVEKSKIEPEDVFLPLFNLVLEQMEVENNSSLGAWASIVNQLSLPVTSTAAIALPAGLPPKQRDPVLNALSKATKDFLKRLRVKHSKPVVVDMTESEMVLLGAYEVPPGYKYILGFDCGGSTYDNTLLQFRTNVPGWNYDHRMSNSIAAGTANEVTHLFKRFSGLKSADSKALRNWAIAAAKDDDEADKPFGDFELGDEWRNYYYKSCNQVELWLEDDCKKCKNIIGTDNTEDLLVCLSGGALINKKLAAQFEKTIKAHLPNCKIENHSFTIESTSLVLRGLQKYASQLADTPKESPVTILMRNDATLEQGCEDVNYVILTMKGDLPVESGPIRSGQARPGEVITHDVSWVDGDDLEVVYLATRGEPKDVRIHEGLLITSEISEQDCYIIGRVTLPKPQDDRVDRIFIACWPYPAGRTICTVVYVFKNNGEGVDLTAGQDVLQQKASTCIERFHGLDTYALHEFRTMEVVAA